MSDADFEVVFKRLRATLHGYADGMDCTRDAADDYWLDTRHIMKNRKPLFFAAVQIKKKYVSYHLMPVYVYPELLDDLSPALKKRMQGKSCFNFRQVDDALFGELEALTERGYRMYRAAGYV